MMSLPAAVGQVQAAQRTSNKPLAIVLAGHNGSGKSTMWYGHLASTLRIPLINADRMMLSILPEFGPDGRLPDWAAALRDSNTSWMQVAQQGVEAFVARAMARQVPFAMETVFSHWRKRADGSIESKIDRIRDMRAAGYFVVLFFVGLTSRELSIARVLTRVSLGGHNVDERKLMARFPRTQQAVEQARLVADATILVDNSREESKAFTVCRIQLKETEIFDLRNRQARVPAQISPWLDRVAPRP
jgi:predicted ABC-type ATPase